jgi:hypothetical protein
MTMTKITTTQAADLEYYMQPRDQGQIVEVSYACDPDRGLLVRRSHDRSDGTTVYAAAEIDESLEQDGDFQPWNGGLPVVTGDFESI